MPSADVVIIGGGIDMRVLNFERFAAGRLLEETAVL
jgi:hypothetical protein